ncbi:transposase [Slackia isoflavoniconvertens]
MISIDIDDFPSHDGLASYCGLAPRNRQSSTPCRPCRRPGRETSG